MSVTLCQAVTKLYPKEHSKMLRFHYLMANIDFSVWLQSELDERGWSQSDLARESGSKPASISRLLQGTRNPGPDVCQAIAKAFGYPPDVVYRAAGLLPANQEMDEETVKMMHLFEQMAPEDQEMLIGMAQVFLDRRGARGRTRPAEG